MEPNNQPDHMKYCFLVEDYMNIYVGNLPYSTVSQGVLTELFSQYGEVSRFICYYRSLLYRSLAPAGLRPSRFVENGKNDDEALAAIESTR